MADKRKIGKSGLKVNPVGLGCMGFSHAYGAPTEKKEAISMIRKAYDIGYDFFDTAECYICCGEKYCKPDGQIMRRLYMKRTARR